MKTKPSPSATTAESRNGSAAAPSRAGAGSEYGPMMNELHRRAEAQMRTQRKNQKSRSKLPRSETDPKRLLHELQVHQVELELQNEELRKTRDEMEAGRDKYSDLYDFAPIGYFTLAPDGKILQLNLTGADLVGMERSRLVGQPFGRLVPGEVRPAFHAFLKQVFAGKSKQSGDFELSVKGQPPRTVHLEAQRLLSGQECRVAVIDITVRRRAEEELQDREARLRAFLKNSAIIGWLKDEDGRHIFLSENYERRFGVRLADWQGKTDFEVWPKKTAEEFRRNDQTVLASGNPIEVIESTTDKEGRTSLWLNNKFTFRDTAGRRYVGGLGVDITERKRAEDKVRVSEVRYRRLFETAHDGVLLIDPVTRKITDANPLMTNLLGYSHAQFVGKELFEIGLLKDKAASRKMFQKLKRDREVRYDDLPLESKGGRHQEVEVLANLYQENGHAVIQCNIRDITARKAAEIAMSRLAAIVEFSEDGIIGKDTNGIITSWNSGAEIIFGYSAREMVGTSIMRLIPDDRREEERCILAKIKSGEGMKHFETLRKTKDGRLINVSVTSSPIKDATGKIIGASKVVRDITARKEAEATQRRVEVLAASNKKLEQEIVRRQAVEQSLRKSERHQAQLLEQSHRLQEQLRQLSRQILTAQEEERLEISRELHDVIAQTLTGINIRLAALKKEAVATPGTLDRNIARTQRLVEKSVDIVHRFARNLRPAVLDNLGLVPALHAFMKSFTTRTGIRASLKAAAKVEQLDLTRRTVLFRVAQEALTNVARHAQASQVKVTVQKLPESFRMSVTDDGQSFDVRRTHDGKGRKRLGLIGMRERMEMVGGCFDVESTPGKGTTIVARIPLGKVARRGGGGGVR